MKTIIVSTRVEAVHNWPEAIEGVDFLKNKHRHEFHYRLEIEVLHNDRELEFILIKRWLDSVIPRGDIGSKSCEMLAEELLKKTQEKVGFTRYISVSVFEDGENGSMVCTRP